MAILNSLTRRAQVDQAAETPLSTIRVCDVSKAVKAKKDPRVLHLHYL